MKTTNEIFKRHNFFIIDKIMNDGTFNIKGKMVTNPLDKKFNKPLTSKSPNKPKINETRN